MAISGIKSAIKSSVESHLGIQCHTGMPVVFTPPCAFIRTGESLYDVNLPVSKAERLFEITVIVARAEDVEDAQAKIEAYMLPTGTTSMVHAIITASVSTDADFIHPERDTGIVPVVIDQQEYIGCRWYARAMI